MAVGRTAVDDAGVLDLTCDLGLFIGIFLISSETPGVAEEAPGTGLRPPHLWQTGRGGVTSCPPGLGPIEVGGVRCLDKLRELKKLLRNRVKVGFEQDKDKVSVY